MSQLTGKVILVVGATSGIGRAVASRVAAERAAVVVARRRAELGAQVCGDIISAGGQAVFTPATRPERATSRQQLRSPSIGSVTSMAPSTTPAACWQPVHSLTYPPPTGRPN
jgi:NAD(P)-dependent dehydrogenase (short-subunit alcohol dehydrogenase family)